MMNASIGHMDTIMEMLGMQGNVSSRMLGLTFNKIERLLLDQKIAKVSKAEFTWYSTRP